MIFGKIKKIYDRKLYFKINHIRGTTRLRMILKNLAERESESISDDNAESIFENEWKNLIILDACRHDIYEELYGETDYRISLGNKSIQYIKRTYSEGEYDDVIYINSNPHLGEPRFEELTGRKRQDVFHTVFDVYEDKWDEELGTVRPEKVFEAAKTAEKLFPDKKKVIHFMQPHAPYLNSEINHFGFSQRKEVENKTQEGIWSKVATGEISKDQLRDSYRRNLKEVKKYAEKIVEDFEGKTVITADHGDFLGKKGLYGHDYQDSTAKILRKVPWDERP